VSYNPTAITSLAQGYVPFASAEPIKHLWVSPAGNDSNSGSSSAPFKTISAAMAKAVPGTAVMVKAGHYTDSVRMKSGTADKPIWLVSADGEGAAKIHAPSSTKPVIYGFGNDNMVIKGFEIIGGQDGIKFTQGGHYLANLADNIVIQGNNIHGQNIDGIKVAQARNAVMVGNTIHDIKGANEAIDIFYTRKGIVAYNEIDNIQGQGGIVVKAGSENVKITYNDIDHVQRGIVVGGWAGGNGSSWPAKMGWQAKNLHVEGNLIQNTTKFALLTQGAIDSTITKNAFLPSKSYYTVAATGADNNGWHSKNIKFTDNIVQRDKWLVDGSKAVTANTDNVKAGAFDKGDVGPDGLDTGKGVLAAYGSGVGTEISFDNMAGGESADAKDIILVDSLNANGSKIDGDTSSDVWTIKAVDNDLDISSSSDMLHNDHSIALIGVGQSDASPFIY
jgi:hypothetical protein